MEENILGVCMLQSDEAPKNGRKRPVPANQRGNLTQKSNQLASQSSPLD